MFTALLALTPVCPHLPRGLTGWDEKAGRKQEGRKAGREREGRKNGPILVSQWSVPAPGSIPPVESSRSMEHIVRAGSWPQSD